jgi:hypothetical protein
MPLGPFLNREFSWCPESRVCTHDLSSRVSYIRCAIPSLAKTCAPVGQEIECLFHARVPFPGDSNSLIRASQRPLESSREPARKGQLPRGATRPRSVSPRSLTPLGCFTTSESHFERHAVLTNLSIHISRSDIFRCGSKIIVKHFDSLRSLY